MGSAPTSDAPPESHPEQPWPELPRGLHITRCIAVGGQGIVYEAVRDQPHQIVAIKVPQIGSDPAARGEALAREADLLANLNHPNIVKVFEVVPAVIEGHRVPCVVMECVEDHLPITRFAQQHKLSQGDRVRLLIKAARAVQHMHERLHAYHRDLKPGNILVGRDGEPKLIDVGLALTGDPDQRLRLRGTVMGTIDYMAPEQFARDTAFLTQRTDVYALGVILFELLTGKLPYDLHDLAFMQKQAVISTEPPRKLADHCLLEYPALAHVVEVALRKEPAGRPDQQRWATPELLAAALEEALRQPTRTAHSSPSVSASGQSLLSPVLANKPRRVERVLASVAIVAVATLAAAVWGDRVAEATGLNHFAEKLAFRSVPPFARGVTLERVAVIGFRSAKEAVEVGERLRASGSDIPPVHPKDKATWRPIHRELILTLARAQPTALVYDIAFRVPSAHDSGIYDSVKQTPHVPVVVAYDLGDIARGLANTTIVQPPVCWGGTTAVFGADAGWWADLLLIRGTQSARPMLSLRAAAVVMNAGNPGRFTPDPSGRRIWIDADLPVAATPTVLRNEPASRPVEHTVTRVIRNPTAEDVQDFDTQHGDLMAQILLVMPEQAELDRVTHSMAEVFAATPEERTSWFKGRAVFVGDLSPEATDLCGHPDGRKIWGVYGQAVAYESLLRDSGVRGMPGGITLGVSALASMAPALVLVSGPLGRRAALALLAVTLIAVAAIVICILLIRFSAMYLPATTPVFSAVVALLIALASRFVVPARLPASL